MPKFAVYYIPEETDELYRLGSSIVGYDIRGQRPAVAHGGLDRVPQFSGQWTKKAGPYGIHVTVGDSIRFELGDINKIEAEVGDILKCFNPNTRFTLKCDPTDFVKFWGPVVALRYEPNDHLKVLHAVVVSRVHPLGSGSGYLQRYLSQPGPIAPRDHKAHRTLKFYSPTIFDAYSPHFTLLDPCAVTDEGRDDLRELFRSIFSPFQEITIGSISLVVQMEEGENWRIFREFALNR